MIQYFVNCFDNKIFTNPLSYIFPQFTRDLPPISLIYPFLKTLIFEIIEKWLNLNQLFDFKIWDFLDAIFEVFMWSRNQGILNF